MGSAAVGRGQFRWRRWSVPVAKMGKRLAFCSCRVCSTLRPFACSRAFTRTYPQRECLGDPGQHTFSTNDSRKGKKHQGTGLLGWFKERAHLCLRAALASRARDVRMLAGSA
jgi:hypothetical protein